MFLLAVSEPHLLIYSVLWLSKEGINLNRSVRLSDSEECDNVLDLLRSPQAIALFAPSAGQAQVSLPSTRTFGQMDLDEK